MKAGELIFLLTLKEFISNAITINTDTGRVERGLEFGTAIKIKLISGNKEMLFGGDLAENIITDLKETLDNKLKFLELEK